MSAVLIQYAPGQYAAGHVAVRGDLAGGDQYYDEMCSVTDYLGRKCVIGRRVVTWHVLSIDYTVGIHLDLTPDRVVRVAINNAVKAVRDGTTRRLDCCLLAYFGAMLVGKTWHTDSLLRSIASSKAQRWTEYVLQIGVMRSSEQINLRPITNAMLWLEKEASLTKDDDLKHLATSSVGDVEFLLPLADYLEEICDPISPCIRVLSSAMLSQVRASV